MKSNAVSSITCLTTNRVCKPTTICLQWSGGSASGLPHLFLQACAATLCGFDAVTFETMLLLWNISLDIFLFFPFFDMLES